MNTNMQVPPMAIVRSTHFIDRDSARSFLWNTAGRINAMGVQVSEPTTDISLSRVWRSARPTHTVKSTMSVRYKFLSHVRFLLLPMFLKSAPSMTIFAGCNTNG